MNRILTYLIPLILLTVSATAQTPFFERWAEKPVMHDIPHEYLNEPAVIVLQDTKLDYNYSGDYLQVFRTVHRIVKVLDDKGIEMFNKVTIPASRHTKIESIRARTILPNGKIFELSQDKIKRVQNENGSSSYVFALEGVEINAEIEYLETDMSSLSFFGSMYVQYNVPVLNTFFELDYPKEYSFTEKGFHGFPDAKETKMGNKKCIKIYQPAIAPLQDERFSFYDLFRMRVEYKLNKVKSWHAGGEDFDAQYSWDEQATDVYNEYCKYTDSEKVSINKYLLSIGINGREQNETYKVEKIEDAIKNNIILYSENDAVNDRFDSIILKKTASDEGYVRFFAACFKMAGIRYELGLSSDKHSHKLIPEFQNLAVLNNFVFYFPTLNQYLAPTQVYLRYPIMPATIAGNKAMFFKVDNVGNPYSGVTDIRTIKMMPANDNRIDVTTHVSFSEGMEPLAHTSYAYTGYTAIPFRTAIAQMPKTQKKQKELIDEVITIAHKADDITNFSIAGEGLNNYYKNSPLYMSATVKLPLLMDKTGENSFMLQVGALTGTHEQLYNEKERILPVDFNYPMIENHSITIIIPEDCKIENPEILKTKVIYTNDTSAAMNMEFISDYKLEGNKLTITTSEVFLHAHYGVTEYEYFRSVVNAAADFNKKTLVFTKTKMKHHAVAKAHKTPKKVPVDMGS